MVSLSKLEGVITDPIVLRHHNSQLLPSGLPPAGHYYMEAHGYDADAKLHVLHALNTYPDVDDFCNYLCRLGMARSEADWLFTYILFAPGM